MGHHSHKYPRACAWGSDKRRQSGSQMLHLYGNSDAVHFSGRFDEFVHAVRVDALDFEGGAARGDGDLDGDLDVDLSDLALLLARFGTTC